MTDAMRVARTRRPARVFFSYAPEDRGLRDELIRHLAIMQRAGVLHTWHDELVRPGDPWRAALEQAIDEADVVLLLVSADYHASDECFEQQMRHALQRKRQKKAQVVPVLLRPCDWDAAPFADLKPLPSNRVPVTAWENRDDAFVDIARGIQSVLDANNVCGSTSDNTAVGQPESRAPARVSPMQYDLEIVRSRHRMMIGVAAITGLTVVACTRSDVPRTYVGTLAAIVAFVSVSYHVRQAKRLAAAAAAGVTVGVATKALGQVGITEVSASAGTVSGTLKFAALAAAAGGTVAASGAAVSNAFLRSPVPNPVDSAEHAETARSSVSARASEALPIASSTIADENAGKGPSSGEASARPEDGVSGFDGGGRFREAKEASRLRPSRPLPERRAVRMGATQVSGRLPPEVISRIIGHNLGHIRSCYDDGLRRSPGLAGRLSIRFVIGRDGAVSNCKNISSDLSDDGVVDCVVRTFYDLSFPQPEGGIVTVEYPIELNKDVFTPKLGSAGGTRVPHAVRKRAHPGISWGAPAPTRAG